MSTFIQAAGPYFGTYDASDFGEVEDVILMSTIFSAEAVQSQRYGSSTIDGVYQGGNMFLSMTFKEWGATTRAIFNPFSPTDLGLSGIIGRMNTDIAKQVILTAVSGTTAKEEGPSVRTIPKVLYSPEHNAEYRFGAVQRDVPIVFIVYPTVVSGELRWFTDTAGTNPRG